MVSNPPTARIKAKRERITEIGLEIAEDDQGNRGTNIDLTIRKMWAAARGFVEKQRQDDGSFKLVRHPFSVVAADKMLDRVMGKPVPAEPVKDGNPITAEDRVNDLAVAQLNDLTSKLMDNPN